MNLALATASALSAAALFAVATAVQARAVRPLSAALPSPGVPRSADLSSTPGVSVRLTDQVCAVITLMTVAGPG